MTIPFQLIPPDIRTPGARTEFDSSQAIPGAAVQPWQMLLVAQKLVTGTLPELTKKLVVSADEVGALAGEGSMAHNMSQRLFQNNPRMPISLVLQDDAGAAVQATGSVDFGASVATASGTYTLWIGGRRVRMAVASGDAGSAMAANLAAAIMAIPDMPVVAASATTTTNITAKNGGTCGNAIRLVENFLDEEVSPAGVTTTVTPMSGGTADPDIAEVWPVIGEEQFNALVVGYIDQANLTAMHTELERRWGPLTQNDGQAWLAESDNLSNLVNLGDAQNSLHLSILGPFQDAINPRYEIAAAYGGQMANTLRTKPSRPAQTLPLAGIIAPEVTNRFDRDERELLLRDGIATAVVDSGGVVRIERAITTWQETPGGVPSIAYLDSMTPATLSYIRWDWNRRWVEKYPRSLLADDPLEGLAGQDVVTPNVARGEALAAYRDWMELGLVEDFEGFKESIVVERSATDPNRLEIAFSPNVVNQLRVVATLLRFVL